MGKALYTSNRLNTSLVNLAFSGKTQNVLNEKSSGQSCKGCYDHKYNSKNCNYCKFLAITILES